MNLNTILNEIEKADPEVFDRIDTRRAALKNFGNTGKKIALAAVPVALGSLFQKAYAGSRSTTDTIIEILNYALTLEYLEAEFYAKGLATGLIPAQITNSIQTISRHETAHVNFLRATITSLGGTPITKPTFDFSGGKGSGMGPFKDAFTNSNPDLFLSVAQTFEDTGVRAYKGRAPELVQTGDILTAALRIHSVEARHAAHIREIRKLLGSGVGDVKPWITLNMSNINSPLVQPSYNGEENTVQLGIEIVNINGFDISAEDASEAFDEPLTKEQVLAIIDPFIV